MDGKKRYKRDNSRFGDDNNRPVERLGELNVVKKIDIEEGDLYQVPQGIGGARQSAEKKSELISRKQEDMLIFGESNEKREDWSSLTRLKTSQSRVQDLSGSEIVIEDSDPVKNLRINITEKGNLEIINPGEQGDSRIVLKTEIDLSKPENIEITDRLASLSKQFNIKKLVTRKIEGENRKIRIVFDRPDDGEETGEVFELQG